MNEADLAEAYDGETDVTKILKKLVSSKDIISNAAKMWKEHKEAEDDTFTKYQSIYEEQRKAFQKLKAESNSQNDEAGPAEESPGGTDDESAPKSKAGGKKAKAGGKKTKAGGKKGKEKAAADQSTGEEEDAEEVEVKTYSLADFEPFDGLKIH